MRGALTVLTWIAVLMVGAVTAAANWRFGWLAGHGDERWIYAVGGTVLDVVKTFLPLMLGTFLVGAFTAGTFFRQLAGWLLWFVGVAWSLTCALGLYAVSREAAVGDTLGKQALYKQLTSDQLRKQGELAALVNVRSVEVIDGEIAAAKRNRLWDRTLQCSSATAGESREFCAKIDTLTAEKATVRPAADVIADRERLNQELREIETKLAGIDLSAIMQKADPATDALAKLLGWEAETVKSRLALLIAVLFEFTGLLPWIIHGSHGAPPVEVKALAKAARRKPNDPADEPASTPLELPQSDSEVAQWAKATLVRRKGSFTPSSDVRRSFETWCRTRKIAPWNPTSFGREMTRLGFARRKRAGSMRYDDVAVASSAPDLKIVVNS